MRGQAASGHIGDHCRASGLCLAARTMRRERRCVLYIDPSRRTPMRLRLTILFLTASLVGTVTFGPAASAQEVEPNDTCLTAQTGGAIIPPSVLDASLASPGPQGITDVDFFRLTAAPGTELLVFPTFGARIGLFSDTCTLLRAPSAFDTQLIDFTVPASGTFILGV